MTANEKHHYKHFPAIIKENNHYWSVNSCSYNKLHCILVSDRTK